MHRFKTLFTIIGAVTVLVLAGNTVAFATTGHSFILGKKNTANKITTLKRTTAGSALNLKTTSGSAAPMAVNGRGKVGNLNADMVDGYDSSVLKTGTYLFTRAVTVASASLDQTIVLPAGTYNVGYSAYMIGGGQDAGQAGCYFIRTLGGVNTYVAETRAPSTTAVIPSMSGSGVVTVGPGVTLRLYCFAPHTWTTGSTEPVQIYAIRTSLLSGGSLARLAPSNGARVAGSSHR